MNLASLKLISFKRKFFLEKEYKKFIIPGVISFVFIFGFTKGLLKLFLVLRNIPVVGEIVSVKVIDLLFFALFFFLILSNVVTAFGTFLKDREIEFLLRFPLKKDRIFLLKFFETLIYSSWAPLLLIIPFLYAYLKVFTLPLLKVILIVLSLPFYFLISSLIGILTLTVILKISPRITREGAMLVLTFFFMAYLFIYIKIFKPELFKIFDEIENLKLLAIYLQKLGTVSPFFLPSRWITNFINYNGVYLLLNFLLFPFSLFVFLPVYFSLENLHFEEHRRKRRQKIKKLKAPLLYSKILQIWIKEWRSITRDFSQFSQAIFLLVMVIFYVISIRKTPFYFQMPVWHALIATGNFIFLGYLFATLSIRFLFPSYSLESRGISFFKMSPVSSVFYIFSKISIWILIFTGLTYLTYYFTVASLNLKFPEIFKVSFNIILVCESLTLGIISMSMGIIYPSLKETNPSKIASSTGAFFTAVITISYVFLIDSFIARPLYIYARTGYLVSNIFVFYVLPALFVSFILVALFFSIGLKFYNKQEI